MVATVRSLGSPALQALQAEHGKQLAIVVMDVGDFASIKVRLFRQALAVHHRSRDTAQYGQLYPMPFSCSVYELDVCPLATARCFHRMPRLPASMHASLRQLAEWLWAPISGAPCLTITT